MDGIGGGGEVYTHRILTISGMNLPIIHHHNRTGCPFCLENMGKHGSLFLYLENMEKHGRNLNFRITWKNMDFFKNHLEIPGIKKIYTSTNKACYFVTPWWAI